MSLNHEQPLSRRAAREAAERSAREAAQGSPSSPERGAPAPMPPTPPPSAAPPSAAPPTATTPSAAPASAAPPAPSTEPEQRVRRRDFRPPAEQSSRRASFATTLEEDAPLEYRTERPASPPPSHHVAEPQPGDRQPSAPHVISERTLSRRELRTLREAQEQGAAPPAEASAPPQHTAPEAPSAPQAPSGPQAHSAPASHGVPETHSAAQAPSAAVSHTLPSPAPLPPSAPTPPPLIEPSARSEHSAAPHSAAPPSSAPTGSHWSVGAHDDEDPFTNTFSREVGAASTSTNALVLPQMPQSNLSGPVGGTGEIIVTGMIEVPRIVTSTGTVPSMHDSPDIDDYLEPGDVELTSTNSAPISALRAVSGHTSSSSMINSKPHRNGNTITTVLVASTVVMAVVAIGLFVLAAVNGLF